MRADKSVWPSQLANIVSTSLVTTKPFIHSLKSCRVVNSGNGMWLRFHPGSISFAPGVMKGIPSLANLVRAISVKV